MRRSPMKRTRRNTGPSSEVVSLVLDRAHYSCEVCSMGLGEQRGVDWSAHHRRPRQMGGTNWPGINLPSNILIVCGSGTTGCHGVVESHRTRSVAGGWLVLSCTDPAEVTVLICRDRWLYLGNDGAYHTDPPADRTIAVTARRQAALLRESRA